MTDFEKSLNDHLNELLLFTRSKVNDPQLAADIVQDSLLKALKAKDNFEEGTNIRAWLYTILRNTISDVYRKKTAQPLDEKALENLATTDDIDQLACRCMEKLIPSMKQDYALLIRELELRQRSTRDVAERLHISAANLKVKRHRARLQLKQRLQETCRLCARHGCLDCDCAN